MEEIRNLVCFSVCVCVCVRERDRQREREREKYDRQEIKR